MDKFYIDLKWTKTVKGPWKNRTLRLRSIFDVLQVAGLTAINILIEGEDLSNIRHNVKAEASERTCLASFISPWTAGNLYLLNNVSRSLFLRK